MRKILLKIIKKVFSLGAPTLYEHIEKLRNEVEKAIYEFDFKEFNKMKAINMGVLPTMVKFINGNPKMLHNQYIEELGKNTDMKIFNSKIRCNDNEVDNNNGIPFVLNSINRAKTQIELDFKDLKEEFLKEVK